MNASKVKLTGGKVPHSDPRGEQLEKSHLNEKRVGTWNVRTLLQSGKLKNLLIEMERLKLDILGIAEMRWPMPGDFWMGDYRVIHSGTQDNRPGYGGVGIVLQRKLGNRVKGFVQYNERLMLVRIETKPKDTVIVQVYMPTTDESEEVVERCYEDLSELIEKIKSEENLIVLGDWNAIVGEGAEGNVVGKYGLGQRNERGERLAEFCSQHKLVVTNTLFQHHLRRRYTWKAPGDIRRAQLDYILVRQRFRNQVKDSRSYPGADVDSDHNLVVMRCELKFKRLKLKDRKQWDISRLKDGRIQSKYIKETDRVIEETKECLGVEQKWNEIKMGIELTAKDVIGKKKQEIRKEWISQEVVEMINERRKYKNSKDEEGLMKYKSLRNRIIRRARQDKEVYLINICDEIEKNMKSGQVDIAYRNVKRFFESKKVRTMSIEDKDGILKYDRESIAKRWKEYLEQLYGENNVNLRIEGEDEVVAEDMGAPIMMEEFERALQDLKERKAPGVDNIQGELLKKAGERLKGALYDMVCSIYVTGEVPEDFVKCIIVPLPKKPNARSCEEYRTLSLVCHASKIVTGIIRRRIEKQIDEQLSEDQFGFRKGVGTREAILALRQLIEKQMKKGKRTCIAFVDLEKAFDRVNWKILFDILRQTGISYRDRRLIHNIYTREIGVVRDGSNEESAHIQRGVRQGCSLSPYLFNLYVQKAIDRVREEVNLGLPIHGERIDMIRFADDIALMTESEEDLQRILNKMDSIMDEEFSMKINTKKTKILVCCRSKENYTPVTLRNEVIKEVSEFNYLGSKITNDGRSCKDITSRIAQAKNAFNKKKGLFTSRNISLDVRKRMLKTYVWSIATYGSEAWTMGVTEERRLEAFEAWCYRRMLKVSWRERWTNEEVFNKAEEERSFLRWIKRRRARLIGHIIRHDGMLKMIIEGVVEGKNLRGRPRLEYMKQLLRDMRCASYCELRRKADDRGAWRVAANQL